MSAPELDWGDGSYERTATALTDAADVLLDALAVAPGERVLDVGCGTGNVALAAAARGAQVTGVDPSARLLERAQERPGAARVTWAVMEGEDLPVPEAAFDVVASCFAVIFAPDAERAAVGLRRSAAPGGRIGLTAWLPEGGIAEAGRILRGALAPGPPPTAWFEPEVAERLLVRACASSRGPCASPPPPPRHGGTTRSATTRSGAWRTARWLPARGRTCATGRSGRWPSTTRSRTPSR